MIGTMIALYALIVLDSMFSGICAASGRNALIHKRYYYVKSMVFGVVCGQVVCVVGSLLIFALVATTGPSTEVLNELAIVGRRMVFVYSIYTVVVLATFAVRAIPSVDVRSLTSTLGFGPLTFIRSGIIAIGVIYGVLVVQQTIVLVAALLAGILMLPLRLWMSYLLERFGVGILITKKT